MSRPRDPTRRALQLAAVVRRSGRSEMTALISSLSHYASPGRSAVGQPIIGIAHRERSFAVQPDHIEWPAVGATASARPRRGIRFRRVRSRRPAAADGGARPHLLPGPVEVLFGYPLDGVGADHRCDKTTPACLMEAATSHPGHRAVAGRAHAGTRATHRVRDHRLALARAPAAGEIDYERSSTWSPRRLLGRPAHHGDGTP